MALISIDPGLRGCGVAVWRDNGDLSFAKYVPNPETDASGPKAWRVMARAIRVFAHGDIHCAVLEVPRVYPGVRDNDPNDLLQLAGVLGAAASYFHGASIVAHYPAEWKGQVPKAMMTKRIQGHLGARETQLVMKVGRMDHNTWDAVGLGLFHLGRMKRGGA